MTDYSSSLFLLGRLLPNLLGSTMLALWALG